MREMRKCGGDRPRDCAGPSKHALGNEQPVQPARSASEHRLPILPMLLCLPICAICPASQLASQMPELPGRVVWLCRTLPPYHRRAYTAHYRFRFRSGFGLWLCRTYTRPARPKRGTGQITQVVHQSRRAKRGLDILLFASALYRFSFLLPSSTPSFVLTHSVPSSSSPAAAAAHRPISISHHQHHHLKSNLASSSAEKHT